MSARRVDIRSRVFPCIYRSRKTVKKKSPGVKRSSKNIVLEISADEVPRADETTKSRRRRLDANDYIRRRFLYDNDPMEKLPKPKQANVHRRAVSRDMKFRNSPLALMAASSANLQKKRKRFHDKVLPSSDQSYRCRRGRRPKLLISDLVGQDKSFDNSSLLDGDSSADERISVECGNQMVGNYADRNVQLEHDENSHLLKPLFRKTHKKNAYRHDGDSSSDALQSHPDYAPSSPGFFLNEDMNDFTRSRGPLVLSKRARHRLVPRPSPPSNDFIKHMTEFPEFGLSDADEAFRHQIHGAFSLDQVVSASEANRVAGAEWSGHLGESVDPSSINPAKHPGVEIEDFAGDLLPQLSTTVNCAPTSGSSRRKSPIRPMQVLRNEPILYHAENGGSTSVNPTGANLIQQKQLVPSFSQPPGSETVSTVAAGLVDLCAAAGLDSTASNQPQLSNITTECTDSGEHSSQSIIANVSQYSLINSNLVSLQPGGKFLRRVFVEASPRTPIAGYTVTPAASVSRVSLIPGRYNYGQPYTLSRMSHSTSGTKSVSATSGSANSSANSSSRRRPTILKRGAVPTPILSANSVSKTPTGYNVPRLSPPFMRTALRSVQASSLVPGAQPSTRPVTYTIVSAAASGQPSVIAVASTSIGANSSTSQTASSRLFGLKRSVGTPPTTEARPISSFSSSSNLTLISCLPSSSLVSSAQQPVRYAFVRGASDGKKYVLLGGNTSLGVTNYKSPLQSTETSDKEVRCAIDGESCGNGDAFMEPSVVNAPAFYSRTASSDADVGDSNQNLPPEQTTAMVS
ncbi:unnamed protein product [Taenia asiatica]|uniref:Non-specific serine/threonine protein kinase n=1 Tax=Taenia asiatica TaxID=60517 RepID=A0A0R3WB10_TAEAS|nr:unnamed protein product [Taenia asiatica]